MRTHLNKWILMTPEGGSCSNLESVYAGLEFQCKIVGISYFMTDSCTHKIL